MSLNVYTDIQSIPEGMDIVNNNDTYFLANTQLMEGGLIGEILGTVDEAEYVSSEAFISRVKGFGALNKSNLSTGTKTLLNIIQHPQKVFNVIECGDNALNFLSKLHEGNVLWEHPIIYFPDDMYDCDIEHEGKKYTKISDFLNFCRYGGEDDED